MNRSEQVKKRKLWTLKYNYRLCVTEPLTYPISSPLKILQLITILNPIIIESIEDPP